MRRAWVRPCSPRTSPTQAILAGHSALFTTTAADLLLNLNLNGQETARALERRLRHYTRPALLAIDCFHEPAA